MPIGPQLPPHLAAGSPKRASTPSDDEEDDFGPALPPHLAAKRANVGPQLPSAGPSRVFESPSPPRITRAPGPSAPGTAPPPIDDDDSDDDFVGPRLDDLGPAVEKSAADEFREREARLAAQRNEDAAKPKVQQRDDWMLAPPPTGALASLDPTKRATTFQKTNRPAVSAKDQAVWTETPAQRAQREKDELLGIKRRAEDGDDAVEKRRKRERDEAIRNQVERHTKSSRGDSLLDQHAATKSGKDEDDGPPMIWDHDKMMGVTGRLLTDQERAKKIKDARGLNDRFGHGRDGAYS